MRKFDISLEPLKEVERLLSDEFTRGLKSEGEDVMVKMLVTHIHEMPKGTEKGEFLVVDLGVNHFRVLHISELTYSILVFSVIYMYIIAPSSGVARGCSGCSRTPFCSWTS